MKFWDTILIILKIIKENAGITGKLAGAALGLIGFWMGTGERISRMIALADQLFQAGLSATSGLASGAVNLNPLAFVNYVFPLDEMIGYVSTYIVLLTVAAILRMVKSFIPTIS